MVKPSLNDTMREHLAWIKLYAEMMTIDNWRDMNLRIKQQAGEAIDFIKATIPSG